MRYRKGVRKSFTGDLPYKETVDGVEVGAMLDPRRHLKSSIARVTDLYIHVAVGRLIEIDLTIQSNLFDKLDLAADSYHAALPWQYDSSVEINQHR